MCLYKFLCVRDSGRRSNENPAAKVEDNTVIPETHDPQFTEQLFTQFFKGSAALQNLYQQILMSHGFSNQAYQFVVGVSSI